MIALDPEAILARAEHLPAARAYLWVCRLVPRPVDAESLARLMNVTVAEAGEVLRVVEGLTGEVER